MSEHHYEDVFIARQPIFDLGMNTWGHALLFRRSAEDELAFFDDDFDATMKVVANMAIFDDIHCCNSQRVLVHFPAKAVVEELPLALPGACTVIVVPESGDLRMLDAVLSLKQKGYCVAVDNYSGDPASRALHRHADILIVDMLRKSVAETRTLVLKAQGLPAQLLAKRVEGNEAMERARGLGFSLFQGFFFRKPDTLSGRTIAASQISRLKLFEVLEREEPDYDLLTRHIEADVAISYRLLNYLNSSAFSFSQRITSIRQAVVLSGWQPTKAWLRMVLLSDVLPSEKTQELVVLSAQRAKFLETLALVGDYQDKSDSLFLLGLFSLLEAMFERPMREILRHLPLQPDIVDALCGKDNALGPWLRLVKSIEDSDWTLLGELAHGLRLPPGSVAESYRESYNWVDNFFGAIAPACKPR